MPLITVPYYNANGDDRGNATIDSTAIAAVRPYAWHSFRSPYAAVVLKTGDTILVAEDPKLVTRLRSEAREAERMQADAK